MSMLEGAPWLLAHKSMLEVNKPKKISLYGADYVLWQDRTGIVNALPNACVQSFTVVERQGIIWMWAGGAEAADKDHISTVADLDNLTVASSDYMLDLPYDQTYFIENAIDPSHLFISHDGTLGSRKNAQPLAMEVLESSIFGIQGKYKRTRQPNENWTNLNFVAPNLITYTRR